MFWSWFTWKHPIIEWQWEILSNRCFLRRTWGDEVAEEEEEILMKFSSHLFGTLLAWFCSGLRAPIETIGISVVIFWCLILFDFVLVFVSFVFKSICVGKQIIVFQISVSSPSVNQTRSCSRAALDSAKPFRERELIDRVYIPQHVFSHNLMILFSVQKMELSTCVGKCTLISGIERRIESKFSKKCLDASNRNSQSGRWLRVGETSSNS